MLMEVKKCIDDRRVYLFNNYVIGDPGILTRMGDIFERMNELADGCQSAEEFEARVAADPVSNDYAVLKADVEEFCEKVD